MSRRRWAVLAVGLVVLALAAGAAAAWHFSSAVLVPDHSAWPAEVEIEALPPGRVVLERGDGTRAQASTGLSGGADGRSPAPWSGKTRRR